MQRALFALLVWSSSLLVLSCGSGLGPSSEVVLSESELNSYVSELDRRLTAWYGASPVEVETLRDILDSEVTFIAESQPAHPYCYFSAPGNVIVFDPQHKNSGCMPHEIGHWALRRADFSGWCTFEHPGEEDRDCN